MGPRVSYFIGDCDEWMTGIRSFSQLVYEDVWPGIDLLLEIDDETLKYEFTVAPGADPAQIWMRYDSTAVRVDEDDRLILDFGSHQLADDAPVAWTLNGGEVGSGVEAKNCLECESGATYRTFEIGPYDRSLPLVIDPAIRLFSGYFGGEESDVIQSVAFGDDGSIYIVGDTTSNGPIFPVRRGPDLTYNGARDAFVAKLDSEAQNVEYCGYLGGSSAEEASGVAVDSEGRLYVTGRTFSADFPVVGGLPYAFAGGFHDVFVARVNPSGTALEYSSLIGGAREDFAEGIAVDPMGAAYLIGWTSSDESTFPVVSGPDLTFASGHLYGTDSFVAKVAAGGQSLVYCGYVGGDRDEYDGDIAVNDQGEAFLVGTTYSASDSFPVAVGPSLVYAGDSAECDTCGGDAYVAKLDASGSSFIYCGYIGGEGWDAAHGVDLGPDETLYVTGVTNSNESTFPVAEGPDLSYNGPVSPPYKGDGFVAKVAAKGDALHYCGYIGGSGDEYAFAVSVDSNGNAAVVGQTDSTDFPVRFGPVVEPAGRTDAFVCLVDRSGRSLVYSGFLGGSAQDTLYDVDTDRNDDILVGGWTASPDIPTVGGPVPSYIGNADGFLSKIRTDSEILRGCRRGTVNRSTGASEQAVFVNGTAGDILSRVYLSSSDPIEVSVMPSSAGPQPAQFALYAWANEPVDQTVTVLPFALGTSCLPTYLSGGGEPLPRAVWNNAGRIPLLGRATMESSAAPWAQLVAPSGSGRSLTATLQGILEDAGSAADVPASVTNAVVIVIDE